MKFSSIHGSSSPILDHVSTCSNRKVEERDNSAARHGCDGGAEKQNDSFHRRAATSLIPRVLNVPERGLALLSLLRNRGGGGFARVRALERSGGRISLSGHGGVGSSGSPSRGGCIGRRVLVLEGIEILERHSCFDSHDNPFAKGTKLTMSDRERRTCLVNQAASMLGNRCRQGESQKPPQRASFNSRSTYLGRRIRAIRGLKVK